MHGAFLFCRKSPAAFSEFRFISFHFISFHFTSYCSPVPLLSFTRRCYLMIILLFLSVCTCTLEGFLVSRPNIFVKHAFIFQKTIYFNAVCPLFERMFSFSLCWQLLSFIYVPRYPPCFSLPATQSSCGYISCSDLKVCVDTTKVRDQLRINWMVSRNVFMPEYH